MNLVFCGRWRKATPPPRAPNLSYNHSKEACCNNASLAAENNRGAVQGDPFELEVYNAEAPCW